MTLLPVLALIGISLSTIAIVAALVALSELLGRALRIRGEFLWVDGLSVFAVLISLFALTTGVFGSTVPGMLLLMLIGALATVGWIRGREQSRANPQEPGAEFQKVLGSSLLYSTTLALLGWSSLRFFALGLAVYLVAEKLGRSRLVTRCALLAIPAGFVASLNALSSSSGQFWLSFDQLYRSALAAGLANWGISDHIGATGTPVRYHWLGEAVAGIFSRFTPETAIDSVTRLLPAVGILVCVNSLRRIGSVFGFGVAISSPATILTIALGQVFEVYSAGSLWGMGLFLIGLISMDQLWRSLNTEARMDISAWFAVFLVTPLIAMSQSTLGIHYVTLVSLTAGLMIVTRRLKAPVLLLLAVSQVAVLFVTRQTLLASTDQHFYEPRLSIRNFLQFRGVDVYVGSRPIFVVAASLLFLLVITQMMCGWWLSSSHSPNDRYAVRAITAVAGTSLVLANVFTIGGPEAQQARFLIPLITIGTFFSLSFCLRAFQVEFTEQSSTTIMRSTAITIGIFLGGVILLGKYSAFNLQWSQRRTLTVGVVTILVQGFMICLLVVWRRYAIRHWIRQVLVSTILAIALTADGRQIRDLIGLHQLPVADQRVQQILGNSAALQCIDYVRMSTANDSVIAGNWYRTPTRTRDSKYFLVSAGLERRTFVDGPNFVGYPQIDRPWPSWLNDRILVVDDFAERATKASYDTLRAAGVEYFLADRLEVVAGKWEPYADIVVETDACYVLKLRA